MKKGIWLQYLLIFGSYGNMFLLFGLIPYIQRLFNSKNPIFINQATGVTAGLVLYIVCFYGITIIYWAWSYFQTFKEANQLERQNMSIKDVMNIKKYEGVGIMNKKLVKFSKLNVEDCFRDREILQLYKKINKRLHITYTKDVRELTQSTSRTEDTDVIEYEWIIDDVDFSAYNLNYLIYRELPSFFNEAELRFLEKWGILTGKDFEDLTIEQIDDLEVKYILAFGKKRDLKEIQLAYIETLDIFSKEELSFFEGKGIYNMKHLLEYDLDQLSVDYFSHFGKKEDIVDDIILKFREIKVIQNEYHSLLKNITKDQITFLNDDLEKIKPKIPLIIKQNNEEDEDDDENDDENDDNLVDVQTGQGTTTIQQQSYVDPIIESLENTCEFINTYQENAPILYPHIDILTINLDVLIDRYKKNNNNTKKPLCKSLVTLFESFVKVHKSFNNILNTLNKKEKKFLSKKNVDSPELLLEKNLDIMIGEYQKTNPVIDRIKKIMSKLINKNNKDPADINFNDVVELVKEKIIENEKSYLYALSRDARFKHTYLKLVNMKALHYEYKAYLVEFDRPIVLHVGHEEYSIYSKYEHGNEMLTSGEENFDEDFAYIRKALIILPTHWEKSFDYQPDYLFDFGGHAVPCSKVTEVEYIFKNMLDSEHAVLFCNSNSYIREHVKTSLDVDVNIINKIEKLALLELLHVEQAKHEILFKRIDQLIARVETNKETYQKMLNDIIEDLDTDELIKKWQIKKEPLNAYTQIMLLLVAGISFALGMIIMYAIKTVEIQGILYECGYTGDDIGSNVNFLILLIQHIPRFDILTFIQQYSITMMLV